MSAQGHKSVTHLRDLPRPLVAVLSSGFFGFFAHAGFLQALRELGVEPDAYAGSSSGALVAAFAAAGLTPARMLEDFHRLQRADFWDPPRGGQLLAWAARRLRGRGGWLAGEAFEQQLHRFLPVATFEELSKPCLVATLDLASNRRRVFTSGPLAPVIRASGAVPGLFAPVRLNGAVLVDGGVSDKAPLLAAARELGAASATVHLLPSSSLGPPVSRVLGASFSPLRVQARAVDAAREQSYEDQLVQARQAGLPVWEARAQGLPRLGPRRLANGPAAFEAARQHTLALAGAH